MTDPARTLPLDVRCPLCGAVPGTHCQRIRVVDGRAQVTGERALAHRDRRAAAARATLEAIRRRAREGVTKDPASDVTHSDSPDDHGPEHDHAPQDHEGR